MSLTCDDENKCFGVVLRTPPADSTGIPHILEHSVLCGSRKYPIKEPFVELMKGSLNTFLNAFTYPDRTCYPVASANLADFYNLVDVYLDAVLHPRCVADERTFAQEGWHYECDDAAAGDVTLKGVVFNEMKGVYSSPDAVNGRAVQAALFPDTPYAADSGGDPAAIPTSPSPSSKPSTSATTTRPTPASGSTGTTPPTSGCGFWGATSTSLSAARP
jgi:Zn-dependent M16 (insulinase) family peptidase